MKNSSIYWRASILGVLLAAACAMLLTANLWRSASTQSTGLSEGTPLLFTRIGEGLGSEVVFADAGSSVDEVAASVDSAARFIEERSGLAMSTDTRDRLIKLEAATLNGESGRLGASDFAEVLTETALERFSTMDDKELEYASRSFGSKAGQVFIRASGEGDMTPEEFISYAKEFRTRSQAGDQTVRDTLHMVINQEMAGRFRLFGRALPDQFGDTVKDGLTPLQAFLVTYSIVCDDYLDGSRQDLQAALSKLPRLAGATGSGRAYGPYGRIFSTPANLVFNRTTIGSFLNHIEGRTGK